MTAKYSSNSKVSGFLGDMMLSPLAAPVAAAAATAGFSALGGAFQRYQDAKADTAAYRDMLKLHPSLQKRDAAQVKGIFNSLKNVNPILARDPLVAGAWVDNIVENNSTLGDGASNQALLGAVKDLAQIRSHLSGAMDRERGRSSFAPGAVVSSAIENFQSQHTGRKALESQAAQFRAKEEQRQNAEYLARAGKLQKRLAEMGMTPDQVRSLQDSVLLEKSV